MFDRSYLQNPLSEYLRWLKTKIKYQSKNKGLRIGYRSKLIDVKFGKNNMLGQNVIIINSSIDDFSYIADGSVISDTKIGKFCSLGPNIRTAPGKHPTKTIVSTHPSIYSNPHNLLKNFSKTNQYEYVKDVVIGNDVWIGANTIILDGVKIGDGAIVGANSVVTSDVQPYSIVVGAPSKHLKYRFSQEEIDFLLKLKWWDKSDEWIESFAKSMLDIKELIKLNLPQ